jgi:hypothetical protein
MRELIEEEIAGLKNDFQLLWTLRHLHNLSLPMRNIITKLYALQDLLEFYPKVSCLDCGRIIN